MSYTNPMWEQSDYQTPDGKIPYRAWLAGLGDRQARARIVARVLRMKGGNFGDCKPMREGVWELRIDHGTGATACITPDRARKSSCS